MIWIWLACGLDPQNVHKPSGADSGIDSGSTSTEDSRWTDTGVDLGEAPGSIVLTELMIDPKAVDDEVGEWLEVLNRGELGVNLRGITLRDGSHDGYTLDADLILAPGARAVLAAASAELNGGVTADLLYDHAAFSLDNTAGIFSLSLGDRLVDSLSYAEITFGAVKGHSLSLGVDADATGNDNPASWCPDGGKLPDGDYGSPGAALSACATDLDEDGYVADDCDDLNESVHPGATEVGDGVDQDCDGLIDERPPEKGDLVIDEILYDADPVSDPEGEWVELLNLSSVPLLLDGISLDDGTSEATLSTTYVLKPGDWVVLGTSTDTSKNGGYTPDLTYDGAKFQLNDGGEKIRLRYDGDTLDEVDFSDKSFPTAAGEAISLDSGHLDPDKNDDGDNWCKADTNFGDKGLKGTPGSANPGC